MAHAIEKMPFRGERCGSGGQTPEVSRPNCLETFTTDVRQACRMVGAQVATIAAVGPQSQERRLEALESVADEVCSDTLDETKACGAFVPRSKAATTRV
jgi:hypothetical protein